MLNEILNVLAYIKHDDRVRCVVLTGHGNIFCAGADLDSGFGHREENAREHRDGCVSCLPTTSISCSRYAKQVARLDLSTILHHEISTDMSSGGRLSLALHSLHKPIITALNGSAVGVGITMTLPTNIRIAYSKAKIGFVFARRGIVMEGCSSFYLPRLLGYSRAMHLITTGSTFEANHEMVRGLFSEIVEKREDVLPRALQVAEEVVANTSAVSTSLMREMMFRGPSSPEEAHLLESKVLWELFAGKDKEEGVNAFLQKREARFRGSMLADAPSVWPWWDRVDTAYPTKVMKAEDSKL